MHVGVHVHVLVDLHCVCSSVDFHHVFQELLSPEDSFEDEMELEFKRDSLK